MTDQAYVYALAQEIRRVDGNHKLGAAELAEALMPFIRTRLIAELGQEVGAVAGRVETGVVQFGDDWPGVFIRGDNAFAMAMHLRGEDSVWRNAAIKSLAELLESCNVANNPNVRVIPSPAHTSEARDADLVDELVQASQAVQMAMALTSLPLKNEFAKRNGMASYHEVEAWMLNAHRRFDAALAAMRQEGGTP